MLLVQDSAKSLKNLSDILADASRLALEAAVSLLEAHAKPPSADAVVPVGGRGTEGPRAHDRLASGSTDPKP